MSLPSPGAPASDFGEMGSPEPPESERVGKLASDNARLRSELRQAQARAQRAEADATRVRGSTKFQVGDLLVKAARHPRRLLLLPRDLLRLYRLRGHRRTAASSTDDGAGAVRARRSDYTDEVAARLLLPRVAARPTARLAVAGALDPLTAYQWRHAAALTSALPHDGATLIRDVDPDVVVIDTAAAGPFGTWSHLGNPAATDRALAARELIAAAKAQGRAVMLLRSTHDSPGFDALAETCDLVVDLPGGPRRSPWQPGIDLGCVARVNPSLLAAALPGAGDRGVLIAGTDEPTGAAPDRRYDPGIARAWADLLDRRATSLVTLRPEGPVVPAFEQAMRECAVVAIPLRAGETIVGASLLALSALAAGHRLVSPDDPDLRHVLCLGDDEDARGIGWFTYAVGDEEDARRAMEAALAAPGPGLDTSWRLWRAIFERACAPVAWSQALARLGLGADPLAHRRISLVCTDLTTDTRRLGDLMGGEHVRVAEVICDRSIIDDVAAAIDEHYGERPMAIGIEMTGDAAADRARAAQASSSPLLIEIAAEDSLDAPGNGPAGRLAHSANLLVDAVIAYELSDTHPFVELCRPGVDPRTATEEPGPVIVRVIDRDHALSGALPPPRSVACSPTTGTLPGDRGTATGGTR